MSDDEKLSRIRQDLYEARTKIAALERFLQITLIEKTGQCESPQYIPTSEAAKIFQGE